MPALCSITNFKVNVRNLFLMTEQITQYESKHGTWILRRLKSLKIIGILASGPFPPEDSDPLYEHPHITLPALMVTQIRHAFLIMASQGVGHRACFGDWAQCLTVGRWIERYSSGNSSWGAIGWPPLASYIDTPTPSLKILGWKSKFIADFSYNIWRTRCMAIVSGVRNLNEGCVSTRCSRCASGCRILQVSV